MLRVAVSSLENAIVIDMEPTMSMQKRVLYTPSRHPSQLERIATFKELNRRCTSQEAEILAAHKRDKTHASIGQDHFTTKWRCKKTHRNIDHIMQMIQRAECTAQDRHSRKVGGVRKKLARSNAFVTQTQSAQVPSQSECSSSTSGAKCSISSFQMLISLKMLSKCFKKIENVFPVAIPRTILQRREACSFSSFELSGIVRHSGCWMHDENQVSLHGPNRRGPCPV